MYRKHPGFHRLGHFAAYHGLAENLVEQLSKPFDAKRWSTYARKYSAEMRKPSSQRLIALLAALSQDADFSIGSYCDNESCCHRSILRALLLEHGARIE